MKLACIQYFVKESICLFKKNQHKVNNNINSFEHNVAFHIEAIYPIFGAIQMTGFNANTRLELVKHLGAF